MKANYSWFFNYVMDKNEPNRTAAAANGVKTTGVGSVSASVGDGPPDSAAGDAAGHLNHNNNNGAKKQWHWLNWLRLFPASGRNSSSARVVPKSSEVICCQSRIYDFELYCISNYFLSLAFPTCNLLFYLLTKTQMNLKYGYGVGPLITLIIAKNKNN